MNLGRPRFERKMLWFSAFGKVGVPVGVEPTPFRATSHRDPRQADGTGGGSTCAIRETPKPDFPYRFGRLAFPVCGIWYNVFGFPAGRSMAGRGNMPCGPFGL